jgi:hypothetical protein
VVDPVERANELLLGSLRNRVRGFDGDAVAPEDARAQLDWWAQVHRLVEAGMALWARSAVVDEPWRRTGERAAEAWLAKRIDVSCSDARALLGVAARLAEAPVTNEKFRDGDLTVAKAEAITSAVVVAPEAEAGLLDAAEHGSLKRVRDDAARVRAAADPDPDATH